MWAPVYYTTGGNGDEATASAKLQDESIIARYCPALRSVRGETATDANRVVESSNITRVISAVVQGLHCCLDEIVMGQGDITSAVPELVFR